jgi:hypothetical protein
MVLAFAGLAAVVALAGWYDRSVTLRAAEDHVELTVGLMREHALNVFRTQELVHEQIRLHAAELDWEAIGRSHEFASFLQETRNRMTQISSIWLADTMGHVRASSGLPYPRSLTFENRDDFRAHRESDDGMLVGEQHLGTFGLTWRKSSSTGDFDGVIGVEIGVEYFENFSVGSIQQVVRERSSSVRMAPCSLLILIPASQADSHPPPC